jgi:hypothetical protein
MDLGAVEYGSHRVYLLVVWSSLAQMVAGLNGSPWTIVLAVELVVVAPLTEEVGKVLASRVATVGDRRLSEFGSKQPAGRSQTARQ